jgi:hypothetical protein
MKAKGGFLAVAVEQSIKAACQTVTWLLLHAIGSTMAQEGTSGAVGSLNLDICLMFLLAWLLLFQPNSCRPALHRWKRQRTLLSFPTLEPPQAALQSAFLPEEDCPHLAALFEGDKPSMDDLSSLDKPVSPNWQGTEAERGSDDEMCLEQLMETGNSEDSEADEDDDFMFLVGHATNPPRSVWKVQRNQGFWKDFSSWSDWEFKHKMRLSRETFNRICDSLANDPLLQKRKSNFRKPYTVKQRVAVALYFYGQGLGFSALETATGMFDSLISKIVPEVAMVRNRPADRICAAPSPIPSNRGPLPLRRWTRKHR